MNIKEQRTEHGQRRLNAPEEQSRYLALLKTPRIITTIGILWKDKLTDGTKSSAQRQTQIRPETLGPAGWRG